MSLAKKGVPNPKNLGDKHGLWKGDSVSKRVLHKWVTYHKGKASRCEECGLSEVPQGRLKYFEWSNVSGRYLRSLDDFRSLCRPCHAKYDGVISHITKTDHVRSQENDRVEDVSEG